MQLFIKNGLDVFVLEENNCNCIHIMAVLACLNPEAEEYLRSIYSLLIATFPEETTKQLLLQESDNEMRPIEMAVNNGALGLYQDIFETKGGLLKQTQKCGVYTREFYNITEYESLYGDRRNNSLLNFLPVLDRSTLNSKYIIELFGKEYIKEWINIKYRKNLPFMIVWLIVRLIYALIYVVFDNSMTIIEERITVFDDPEYVNITQQSCLADSWSLKTSNTMIIFGLGMYLLIHSAIVLGHDLLEWLCLVTKFLPKKQIYLEKYKTPRGQKTTLGSYLSLWLGQLLMNLFVMGSVSVRLLRHKFDIEMPLTLKYLIYIFVINCMMSSILVFLQIVPYIGIFAIMLQNVGKHFLKVFCVLYALMTTSFFLILCKITNFGRLTCDDNFKNFWRACYSILLLTFSMLNFTYSDVTAEQMVLLIITHITFILGIVVLLLNFFIALYTFYVTEFMKFSNVFLSVEKIIMFNVSEYRLNKLFKRWGHRWEKKYFHTDRDGNLYVSRTLFAKYEK